MPIHQDYAESKKRLVQGNPDFLCPSVYGLCIKLKLTWNKVPLHHFLVRPPSFMNFWWIGLCCTKQKRNTGQFDLTFGHLKKSNSVVLLCLHPVLYFVIQHQV